MSQWFNGPDILRLPIEKWGLECNTETIASLPGEKMLNTSHACQNEASLINYARYSTYKRMLWSLARVIGSLKAGSFAGGNTLQITPMILYEAELFLVKEVQKTMVNDIKQKRGKYSCLNPC